MTGPTVRSLGAPSARGARGQEVVRRSNRSAVLSHVHVAGPTSRAELTAKLALNRSTIGDLTAELVALGLVTEEQPEEGAGRPARRTGRPSLVVRPRSDVTALAVALEVDRIAVALVGLGGVLLRRSSRRHRPGQHDVHHVVDAVTRQVEELLEPGGYTRCVGVGVSVPGVVRRTDALVRIAPNLGWVDEPFSELLASALGMRCGRRQRRDPRRGRRAPAGRCGRGGGRGLRPERRRHRGRGDQRRPAAARRPGRQPARSATSWSTARG